MRHAIQCCRFNEEFRSLLRELPRGQRRPKDRLDTEEGRLSKTTPRIPRLLFPPPPPRAPDRPQVLIALPGRARTGAMVPDLGIPARRKHCCGAALFERFVTPPLVIGTIGADLANLSLPLGQYVRHRVVSRDSGCARYSRKELARRLVHPQVQLSPGAPLAPPVQPYFPLPRAVDFDPTRVHHKGQRPRPRRSAQGPFHLCGPARQGAVTGHRQGHLPQRKPRAGQTLSRPQGQMIDCPQRQPAFDRRSRVHVLCPPLLRPGVAPSRESLLIDPQHEAARSLKAALYFGQLRMRYLVFVFIPLTYQTSGPVAIRATTLFPSDSKTRDVKPFARLRLPGSIHLHWANYFYPVVLLTVAQDSSIDVPAIQ